MNFAGVVTGRLAARVAALVPPLCGGCMDAAGEKGDREEREREERMRQARQEEIERLSGIPERYRDEKTKDLRFPRDVVKVMTGWGEQVNGIVLTGSVGVGKTTLAGIAAWRMAKNGSPVRWATAPLLMAKISAGFGTEGREWATEVVTGSHALVLDDIDKARPSEYGAELIFAAIDERISRGYPLMVTTNQSLSEIALKWAPPYGDAIASRLASCRIVELTGEDRRLTKVRR